ncbi:CPBP family intramembrane glutamic endopeptidase [Allokutzneria sp. NRRL B-24872]|uniref:CPBP family intramembrane glutamic endopeptidase n=1 Tax=Allokutzneria sp. NRRL B-24872 TaxID=1137961 RepID=UPI00143CC877|nr:CPBP family intramembrane glutamic endopeptidase [Allokutzneria sp. NRRL B-24872]
MHAVEQRFSGLSPTLACCFAGLLASGVPAALSDSSWSAAVGVAGTATLLLMSAVPAWGTARPLLLLFAATSVFGWLTSLITSLPGVTGALTSLPIPVAFLAVNSVKLVSVGLAALLARRQRWSLEELHLRPGSPRAGGWLIFGPLLCLLVPGLFLAELPSGALAHLPSVLPWLPVMLAGCLINAAAEEFLYRGAALRAAREVMPLAPALALGSAVFGLSHLGGNPGGWLGVLTSAAFGLVCAFAMLSARGFVWNLAVHVCADLGIVASLTLAQMGV